MPQRVDINLNARRVHPEPTFLLSSPRCSFVVGNWDWAKNLIKLLAQVIDQHNFCVWVGRGGTRWISCDVDNVHRKRVQFGALITTIITTIKLMARLARHCTDVIAFHFENGILITCSHNFKVICPFPGQKKGQTTRSTRGAVEKFYSLRKIWLWIPDGRFSCLRMFRCAFFFVWKSAEEIKSKAISLMAFKYLLFATSSSSKSEEDKQAELLQNRFLLFSARLETIEWRLGVVSLKKTFERSYL